MSQGPLFSIDRIDIGPNDLEAQLPKRARLLRVIPGPDRPDYCLAVLEEAVFHRTTLSALQQNGVDPSKADPQMVRVAEDGTVDLQVFGIVICARIAGEQLHQGMRDFPVSLAYVIDSAAMRDETLDFGKILYAAVAFITDLPAD